jgi:hypothetical protein
MEMMGSLAELTDSIDSSCCCHDATMTGRLL